MDRLAHRSGIYRGGDLEFDAVIPKVSLQDSGKGLGEMVLSQSIRV
jgi:hypothetical protein